MKKLNPISSKLKEITKGEMTLVCGGKTGEVTVDYCYVIESTAASDANWNCSDTTNTIWQDGLLLNTINLTEQP
jgi:hypothetical protein